MPLFHTQEHRNPDIMMNASTPVEGKNTSNQLYSSPKEVVGAKYTQNCIDDNSEVDCDSVSIDSYNGDDFELFLRDFDNEDKSIQPTLECSVNYCNETLDDEISKLETTLLELDDSLSDVEGGKIETALDSTIKYNCKNELEDYITNEEQLEDDLLNEITTDSKLSTYSGSKVICPVRPRSSSDQNLAFECELGDLSDEELSDNLSTSQLSLASESSIEEDLNPSSTEFHNVKEEIDTGTPVANRSNAMKPEHLFLDKDFVVVDECGEENSDEILFNECSPSHSLSSAPNNNENIISGSVSSTKLDARAPSPAACSNSGVMEICFPGHYTVLDEYRCTDLSSDELPASQLKSSLGTVPDMSSDNFTSEKQLDDSITNCLSVKIEFTEAVKTNELVSHNKSTHSVVPDISNENNSNDVNSQQHDYTKQPQVADLDLLKDCDTKPEKEKNKIQPANEDFVSNDPQENADNNNPEWEVLRKLETDEERYKAMRQRWRSLVIPDPNQNLTYLHCKYKLNRISGNAAFSKPLNASEIQNKKSKKRKRNKTVDPSPSTAENPSKRLRTRSCTTIFDRKVEELQRTVENRKHQLRVEEQVALDNLGARQSVEHLQLLNSHVNPYRLSILRDQLYQRQREDFELLRERYAHAQLSAEVEVQSKMDAILKAMEEVRAFHSFYQGLDSEATNKDCLLLTDTELEDILDYERLDEKYKLFYSLSKTRNFLL